MEKSPYIVTFVVYLNIKSLEEKMLFCVSYVFKNITYVLPYRKTSAKKPCFMVIIRFDKARWNTLITCSPTLHFIFEVITLG